MPKVGQFVLHAMANPPLKAGDYALTGRQDVAGGATEPYEGHFRITSPRFSLPPDQLLSTFPPANSDGAYETRLPQVVIKRRTLPWERAPGVGKDKTPWLALVVIAEGEGTLSGEVPVEQCVTPGVKLTGPNDVATGAYLGVTKTVVDRVFPTEDDLPLLCHVREVDIDDTELANGDDDGFLAVVLANRLPQYDRTGDKPVRYLACLINVEGQLGVLPKPSANFDLSFLATESVYDVRALAQDVQLDIDHFVMGGVSSGATRKKELGPAAGAHMTALPSAPAAANTTSVQWSTTQAHVEQAALTAGHDEAGRVVRDVMLEGFRQNVSIFELVDPVYRFPVLAHWSFTVSGSGGFESLIHGLDVGLLGTAPAAPEVPAGAPPPPPKPRPEAELTDTGHVGLPHVTRRGERVRAWYRGPCASHPTTRDQPDAKGRLPLAHVSDQLRRIVPDGREDLSLAAAFEIGRLLALSQPSFVRALMAWRAEQFGAERARQIVRAAADAASKVRSALDASAHDLGALIGRGLVLAAAEDTARTLAPSRPLVDPGRPLPFAGDRGLEQIIAEGFGFSAATIGRGSSTLGAAGALRRTAVPLAAVNEQAPLLSGRAVNRLRDGLGAAVDRLTADALKTSIQATGAAAPIAEATPKTREAGRPPSRRRRRDALDELIADAESTTRRDDR